MTKQFKTWIQSQKKSVVASKKLIFFHFWIEIPQISQTPKWRIHKKNWPNNLQDLNLKWSSTNHRSCNCEEQKGVFLDYTLCFFFLLFLLFCFWVWCWTSGSFKLLPLRKIQIVKIWDLRAKMIDYEFMMMVNLENYWGKFNCS